MPISFKTSVFYSSIVICRNSFAIIKKILSVRYIFNFFKAPNITGIFPSYDLGITIGNCRTVASGLTSDGGPGRLVVYPSPYRPEATELVHQLNYWKVP